MLGVPQGGVGDVGTFPARCSQWEEEEPKLNGGIIDHHIQDKGGRGGGVPTGWVPILRRESKGNGTREG